MGILEEWQRFLIADLFLQTPFYSLMPTVSIIPSELWRIFCFLLQQGLFPASGFFLVISLNPFFESQLLLKPAGYQELFHVPQ